jgi:rhamnosyltransferase
MNWQLIMKIHMEKMLRHSMSIGVVFITHHAVKHLPYCLPPFINSPLKPPILVVNSSSGDGTIELAKKMGVETLLIPRKEFNHGTTRERVRKHLKTDIVVMMTPDAYAVDHTVLEKLVQPLVNGVAAVSYARQIPHEGAGLLESFPRAFNYPDESQIRSYEDIKKYGVYTYFCSDACAAYSNSALDEAGGFPSVLFGEDTCAVAALLKKGHRIYYAAEAIVRHSHGYSLKQEFKRHFDIGLSRREYSHLLKEAGRDSQRGRAFVQAYFKQVVKEQPILFPYAFLQIMFKWLGYKTGSASLNAPFWLKKMCSSQDFYWISNEGQKKYL